MTITVQFGSVAERPYYIGMANTFIAPVTIFAPIIGGWLVDAVNFELDLRHLRAGGNTVSFGLPHAYE